MISRNGEYLRIIPTVLIDGINVVKGRNFINDRVVGNAFATAKLYGKRFIDELMILDVTARKENRLAQMELVQSFARELTVPFSIGGGIRSVDDALKCIEAGAEKEVIGCSCLADFSLIEQIASVLGSQAVTISVVFDNDKDHFFIPSEKVIVQNSCESFFRSIQDSGAGEIVVQSRRYDGCLSGLEVSMLTSVAEAVTIPVIVGSGMGSTEDIIEVWSAGASAVAIGALFQFTEVTPEALASELFKKGVPTRIR